MKHNDFSVTGVLYPKRPVFAPVASFASCPYQPGVITFIIFFLACMNDVRYDNVWFPMTTSENDQSEAADLILSENTVDGCDDGGDLCINGWRIPLCV